MLNRLQFIIALLVFHTNYIINSQRVWFSLQDKPHSFTTLHVAIHLGSISTIYLIRIHFFQIVFSSVFTLALLSIDSRTSFNIIRNVLVNGDVFSLTASTIYICCVIAIIYNSTICVTRVTYHTNKCQLKLKRFNLSPSYPLSTSHTHTL